MARALRVVVVGTFLLTLASCSSHSKEAAKLVGKWHGVPEGGWAKVEGTAETEPARKLAKAFARVLAALIKFDWEFRADGTVSFGSEGTGKWKIVRSEGPALIVEFQMEQSTWQAKLVFEGDDKFTLRVVDEGKNDQPIGFTRVK
jgi:hypothetical protein